MISLEDILIHLNICSYFLKYFTVNVCNTLGDKHYVLYFTCHIIKRLMVVPSHVVFVYKHTMMKDRSLVSHSQVIYNIHTQKVCGQWTLFKLVDLATSVADRCIKIEYISMQYP
jgi:hypothetical protein